LQLNSAILKSLEKDPSRRFQCADQFRQALINIESPATVSRPVSRSLLHFWVMRAANAPAVGTLALTSLLLVGSSRPSAKPPAPEVVLLPPQQTGAASIAPAAPSAGSTLRPSNRGIDRPEISAVQSAGGVAKPQRVNPLRRALGKLWRLGRHKKPSSESADTMRVSENQR